MSTSRAVTPSAPGSAPVKSPSTNPSASPTHAPTHAPLRTATPTRTPDENAAPSRRGQAAARPTPGLLDALLQAAGAGNRDLAALGWRLREDGAPFAFEGAELMLNLDALRRTPAAKRTLWRTLRALRRQQHTRE